MAFEGPRGDVAGRHQETGRELLVQLWHVSVHSAHRANTHYFWSSVGSVTVQFMESMFISNRFWEKVFSPRLLSFVKQNH